jgi:myo-inositol 2-dehydrogenase / D-chiro-inositol 1-dehydrogenase
MEQTNQTGKEIIMPDRRRFLRDAASIAALGALGTGMLLQSCSSDKTKKAAIPAFLDQAPDGRTLKVGLIGCGGRGTGALFNFINSGPGIEITALADVFEDRLTRCRRELEGKANVVVADEKCFIGFDGYQKLIETDVDVVILAAPPYFRPSHFDAAVRARKHVFMEKPVAVDPVGARAIMASARMADAAGLKIVCGTQRHHERSYLSTLAQIRAGAIGDMVAANCYWNQSQLWFVNRQPGWTDMEAMLRDWVNWTWLSGDHIVEQHMHNIDVINWYKEAHPVKAVGMGGRHRRPTGDQYDFFSVDFVYDDGMHMHSMCRQINDCANNVSEWIVGTKGRSNCSNMIEDFNGNRIFEFRYAAEGEGADGSSGVKNVSPYDQEIIDLVAAIRQNTPLNEAEQCAISTLTAIMGRISSYTGKEVTWEEMMNSNLRLGPETLEMGPSDIRAVIPVPGS